MSYSDPGRVPAEVPAHLTETLLRSVAAAWERGWQPDDLARVASRMLDAFHLRLLAAAVLEEVARYPAGSVDPRWEPQLGRLRAVNFPARSAASVAPAGLAEAAGKLIGLLSVLPKLQPVGSLPGTHAAGAAPGADERVLGRVRAMLAKAESTTHPAEADTFTAAAQELMTKHSIDLALLAAKGSPTAADRPGARRIGIDNPYEVAKASLLDHVARANRCQAVWTRALGFGTVVGWEADLDAVETLFTSLLVQATTAMTRAGARVDAAGRSRTRAFRRSFLAAYAVRIGQRLTEVTRASESASSSDLLPVLASRSVAVEAAVAGMFPELRQFDGGAVTDAEGYASGTLAADRATLNHALPE